MIDYGERLAFDKGWNHGVKAGRSLSQKYVKELIIHFLRRDGYIEAAEHIRKNYDEQA
jgi:hypothetical protein